MKKDGSKRPARDIYEWLQQFCVEQCAVLLALAEQMPTFTDDLPCQLGRADGYKAPQLCMGCARWWTEHGHPTWRSEPDLFNGCADPRVCRPACVPTRVGCVITNETGAIRPILVAPSQLVALQPAPTGWESNFVLITADERSTTPRSR